MDGPITGADFLAWQRQLGETPPAVSSFDAAISAAIAASQNAAAAPAPEPSSGALGSLLGLAALVRRRCTE
jgi:hypothetical protein